MGLLPVVAEAEPEAATARASTRHGEPRHIPRHRIPLALQVSALISTRWVYAGPETYCDGTGNCATRDVTLTTAPGFDSLTGIGSVGPKFVATLSRF